MADTEDTELRKDREEFDALIAESSSPASPYSGPPKGPPPPRPVHLGERRLPPPLAKRRAAEGPTGSGGGCGGIYDDAAEGPTGSGGGCGIGGIYDDDFKKQVLDTRPLFWSSVTLTW